MTPEQFYKLVSQAIEDGCSPLPADDIDKDFKPLATLIDTLLKKNQDLQERHQAAIEYIRQKINQMLVVIGTAPLRTEEMDEKNLIGLDPLGIISQSFTQILDHSKQTNKSLQLAKDEIQAIFESVGDGLLVMDQERRILSYNNKFKETFCPGEEQITGKACYEVICGDENYPEKHCSFKSMNQTSCLFMHPDWHHGDRHFRVVASPIKNSSGDIINCVVLYVDITELMQARVALDDERERLAITLASIADGVIATDGDGIVTLMNKTAEDLTGWACEDAIGRRICAVMEIIDENDQKPCRDFFNDLLQHENFQVQRTEDTTLVDPQGTRRSIYLSAAPIHQNENSMSGAIIVFRDITTQKRMEEELAKAMRLDSLGIFAGGIAHDFNNLLTGVLGNVSLAKAMVDENNEIFELLNETERSSYRAKGLTQQLLTFSTGGAPIKNKVYVDKLLKESVAFCLRGTSVKCGFSLSDDLWQTEVDEGQINQVIQNLVINASQAMDMTGSFEIKAANLVVADEDEFALRSGNYVKISFTDHGGGISKEDLDKIFDPFFTTKSGGSGLGLATCYSIISRHDGMITAESTLGEGSTFILYLPGHEVQEEAVEEKIHPQKKAGQGKVLIMDDEEIIITVTRSMLEFGGYVSESAANGQEAIDKYKQAMAAGEPFDAILMDLTIPGGMGGKKAIIELLKIDPDIKAIVSSGYANDPIMADYKKHGFCRVIPKPYKMQELNSLIAEVIESKK